MFMIKDKNDLQKWTILCRVLFGVYIFVLLYGTVIGRPVYAKDPFGKLWDDWTVYYRWKRLHYNSAINLILFIPYGFLGAMGFKKLRRFPLLMLASFAMSLSIEIGQFLFHKGTVQISDLVYNTISGCAGWLVFHLLSKKLSAKTKKEIDSAENGVSKK